MIAARRVRRGGGKRRAVGGLFLSVGLSMCLADELARMNARRIDGWMDGMRATPYDDKVTQTDCREDRAEA